MPRRLASERAMMLGLRKFADYAIGLLLCAVHVAMCATVLRPEKRAKK